MALFADPRLSALYDLSPPPAKSEKRCEASRPCGRWRSGCRNLVEGVDPMRTCATCRAAGAPTRVPWAEAKPDGLGCDGEQVVTLGNAALLAHSAKDEVASFSASMEATKPAPKRPSAGTTVPVGAFPCGHPRFPHGGFCGTCNPARM